ncbi:hypothetical protein FA95DRAFT_1613318, partial [Auriscalpium vulgare]
MSTPPDPPGDDSPAAPGDSPDRMNIDPSESDVIVDTATEPPVLPFPTDGVADVGPAVPNTPTTDIVVNLPGSGAAYYVLHPRWKVPVHSHGCDSCTAFLTHLDPSHPSWTHVQEQFKIHTRSQFDAGVSRGLAFASERIATAEGIRHRAEDNVLRLTRQRDVARDAEAAAQARIAELQSQLEAIRAEHTALVRDHAHTTQALDRARAPSRPRSPAPSMGSNRRRSPRPDAKKRKRSPTRPASDSSRRGPATTSSSRPHGTAPAHDSPSWTSVPRNEIHGPLWDRWVPITHDDVTMAFTRAVSDPHASARIRTLALLASDRAISDRSSVMRFLVQQWGARCNSLVAPADVASPTALPVPQSSGGGRAPASVPDWATTTTTNAGSTDAWTTVPHAKRATDSARATAPTVTPAPQDRRTRPPSYANHVDEWLDYVQDHPSHCPRGVPMHPDNSPLRGRPERRMMKRHLEMRLNGPQGRAQKNRSSRGHWVSRSTQLFSIRGLYGRVLHHRNITVSGVVPEARPYTGDTRNISIEDVARHFAANGYQPRSLSVNELEEYAVGRRNAIEGRPLSATTEWGSYPTLADMQKQYPPIHAPSQTAGPTRNLYSNMSLDFRGAAESPRSRTPEGPALSATTGSMSPDFPSHYTPPTPHFVPIDDAAAEPLPFGSGSWADDDFA